MQNNMQKNLLKSDNILFTQEFLLRFQKVVNALYNYPSYMDFTIVTSLTGKKTLSYLPLLSYTDRESHDINDLLELAKENHFEIRTLDFSYSNFQDNDTVTMRLALHNLSSQELFEKNIKSRCRNKIRNSKKKYNYTLTYGNELQDIEAFYKIFTATMHKHGTPVLDKKLFINLSEEFKENILFFNAYNNSEPVATMCIILDSQIAWYPWGGVASSYNNKLAGYFIYWEVIKFICDNYNLKIFDFGRSSYGGSTYNFKSQFGAMPLKIEILKENSYDLYEKYSLASSVWKKLPKNIVDFLGPKLCKYLVDL